MAEISLSPIFIASIVACAISSDVEDSGDPYSASTKDTSIPVELLREVAKEWIKELEKSEEYYGIPIIITNLKKLEDKQFVDTYHTHIKTAIENWIKNFFNIEED